MVCFFDFAPRRFAEPARWKNLFDKNKKLEVEKKFNLVNINI